MKLCNQSLCNKSEEEFYQRDKTTGKLMAVCKSCKIESNTKWNSINPDKRKAISLKHSKSDKGKKNHQQWIDRNRERYRDYCRSYRLRHREDTRAARLNRRHNDIGYRVKLTLRNNLTAALKRQCLKKGYRPTLGFLGCSIPDFKIYLESKFKGGMSWENYGRGGWELDHIMPCAIFDLSKPEHLKRCFHFSNFQPMWALDNKRKHSKVITNQFNLL